MGSFFHNAVLSQDQNQIRVPYGSEAVGDGKGSAALRQFLQGALHQLFALVIPVSYTHLDVYKRQGRSSG